MDSMTAQANDFVARNQDGIQHFFRQGFIAAAELLNQSTYFDVDAFARFTAWRAVQLNGMTAGLLKGFEEGTGKSAACRDRCHFCCFQHVIVTSIEAFHLALVTDRDMAPRIAASAERVAGLSHGDRYQAGIPCVLLKDRRCSVYEARPEPCRTHFSASRTACERDWDRRGQTTKDWWKQIPYIGAPKVFGQSLAMGGDFALMLVTRSRLQFIRGELAAMLAVAQQPGALEAWLDGEAVFPPDIFQPRNAVGASNAGYADTLRTIGHEAVADILAAQAPAG